MTRLRELLSKEKKKNGAKQFVSVNIIIMPLFIVRNKETLRP